MAKFYNKLDAASMAFIRQQKLFFTATAPHNGRINLSPKGMDSLRILDDYTVAYLDVTGSGNETAAHILNDGRLTIMLCSFDTSPLILRLYGHGEVISQQDSQWPRLIQHFTVLPGTRQIIVLHIESLQTSCGFGIPLYDYLGDRDTLNNWAQKKGDTGIVQYWQDKNQQSIDGLPTGLKLPKLNR
jgi:hypothetical protein